MGWQFNHMARELLLSLPDGKEEVSFTLYVADDADCCCIASDGCRAASTVTVG